MSTRDTITLKSGKVIFADRHLISLFKSSVGPYELYTGSNGELKLVNGPRNDVPQFTFDELMEIGEHLRDNWQQFIFALNNGDVPYIGQQNELNGPVHNEWKKNNE